MPLVRWSLYKYKYLWVVGCWGGRARARVHEKKKKKEVGHIPSYNIIYYIIKFGIKSCECIKWVAPNCKNILDKNNLFVLINSFSLLYPKKKKKSLLLYYGIFFFSMIKLSFLILVDSNLLRCLCDTLVLNKDVFIVDN